MKKATLILFVFISVFYNVKAQSPYQVYFGNLHSHTGNSDGADDPEVAFSFARDSAHLDFHAVTDHVEQIDPLEWYFVKDEADNVTVNGSFVGIAGWEWGSPIHGHVNVFNTSSIITDAVNLWYTTDLPAFYNWVLTHQPALAQFNHPGEESYFTNWNDFEYIDSINDNAFQLIEFQFAQQGNEYYEFALNTGRHLSPVWNQDNHSADWGTKNDGRAGIWATDLSRPALFDAINAGRTFATMDKNASVWTDINGNNMGQTMIRYTNMPFHIYLNDGDAEDWDSIQLVTSNGVVMSFASSGNLDTIVPLTLYSDMYVFIRAIQADGDYIWSSPIFFTGVITAAENILISDVKIYPNPATDYIKISFKNFSSENTIVRIRSLEGKLIKEERINTMNSDFYKISLPELMCGLYIVEIESNGIKHYKKISVLKN